MTTAEKLQLPLAGMVLPLKPSVVPATVAATVPPAQVVAALAGLAMVMPLGKLSTTLAPVMAVALGLVKVTTTEEVPPAAIVDGVNPLLTPGPVNPLFTAVTVMAVPGPEPSGSMLAVLTTVPALVAATPNWTVATAPTAITPGDWPGLLTRAAVANGMTPPGKSATALPFSLVLPTTYTVPAGMGSASVVLLVLSKPVFGIEMV